MVLTRPVTKTLISSATFGMPVYDWINGFDNPNWQPLPLASGFTTQVTAYPPARYAIMGKWLAVNGLIYNSTGAGITVTMACSNPIPGVAKTYSNVGFGVNNVGTTYRANLLSNGSIQVISSASLIWASTGYLSFDFLVPTT